MIKTMITRDLSRFILLVFIIVMGFRQVLLRALPQPACWGGSPLVSASAQGARGPLGQHSACAPSFLATLSHP